MAADELDQSFKNLKETIPLLLKHKISAIPTNYALWYTYVANESDEIKQALDLAVENQQQISEVRAKELYRNHLSDSQEVNGWQLRQSVEAMLIELGQSMHDTRVDSNKFKDAIDNRLDDLNKVEQEGWSLEEVMGLVRNMVKETQEIRKSTLHFNAALTNAEDEIARLRSQLEESQQEALYDALTGLANRRYFDQELEAQLGSDHVSLILVDLDHFKNINDSYGHQMGDLVLKSTAKKLLGSCRDSDRPFRYGGEEFAVLCYGADLNDARRLAERLRKVVEKIRVKNRRTGETLGDITASFGVAQLQPGQSAESFIEQADQQLYKAKELGRNRVMPMTS